MIAQLTGTVARVAGGFVVLDVGGVGYKVNVPVTVLESLPASDAPVTLLTHTLVREDDLALYGFLSDGELRVFELLLSVSGIGPKAALALLSALPADALARAAADEDVRTLTRVPGIGAKTAQRLVLELKDKLAALAFERSVDRLAASGQAAARRDGSALADDVISALINLGYNKAEAQRATTEAQKGAETGIANDFAPLLRAALNRLTNK